MLLKTDRPQKYDLRIKQVAEISQTLWLWDCSVREDDLSWGANDVNRNIMDEQLLNWNITHQLLVMHCPRRHS